MSEEILINVTPQETRIAMMENGVVQELQIERSSSLGLVGNVYRGVVCRVLPGMQSAFVPLPGRSKCNRTSYSFNEYFKWGSTCR